MDNKMSKERIEYLRETLSILTPAAAYKQINSLEDKTDQIIMLRYMCTFEKFKPLIYPCIKEIITSTKELRLFFEIYYWFGKQSLIHQAKKGINHKLLSFNITEITKSLNEKSSLSLKDIMYITRPKPLNKKQKKNMAFIHNF